MRGFLVALFLVAASGMQAADDRMVNLGRSLRCMCGGCAQLLEDCNMVGCMSARPMREELRQAIDSGLDDKAILAGFADKFGPLVLTEPVTDTWLGLSAWIMPFAVFVVSAIAILFFLRKMRSRQPVSEVATAGPAETASKYDKEIEDELRKFTPED
jgi:cytochrome c-type biogenesis protein CcmH/NrfF